MESAYVINNTTNASGESQSAPPAQAIIDVHHHFYPSLLDNEGNPWSVQMSLEEMDRNAIASAIAYLSPSNALDGEERRRQTRQCNEWGKTICLDHPKRFGIFASLPLTDIDLSLRELEYAYDVLDVDGVALATNYRDTWLSDERHTPIFEELNRRKAVAFVHPAPTSRCQELSLAYGGDPIWAPWLEFPFNTARAILGLLAKGVTRKYPDIRFIFSHGGGVMPMLLGRVAGFSGWKTLGPEKLRALFPDGIHAEFGKLFFECAQAYDQRTVDYLAGVAPVSHILFGSDFSYFPIAHGVEQFSSLHLDDVARQAIAGGNAAALFRNRVFAKS
jgi:predicted TIM-barrel fold metal-dependent hydrolase